MTNPQEPAEALERLRMVVAEERGMPYTKEDIRAALDWIEKQADELERAWAGHALHEKRAEAAEARVAELEDRYEAAVLLEAEAKSRIAKLEGLLERALGVLDRVHVAYADRPGFASDVGLNALNYIRDDAREALKGPPDPSEPQSTP